MGKARAAPLAADRLKGLFHEWRYTALKPSDCLPMNSQRRLILPLILCVLLSFAGAAETSKVSPPNSGFKIHQTVPLQYPVALLHDGVAHGEARVLLNVDTEGRLAEVLVLAYTQEAFATAALNAIRQWRYEPGRLNGELVGTVADCSFRFDVDGILMVQRMGPPVFQKNKQLGEHYAYQPHDLSALDGIPTPVHIVPPVYPQEWTKQGMRGKVTIDFYIDETGTVRMPSVAATEHPLLAASAAAAVREWRFAAPLRKGRPVLAHCEQVFNFDVNPTKP
jgi:TonB family protein